MWNLNGFVPLFRSYNVWFIIKMLTTVQIPEFKENRYLLE